MRRPLTLSLLLACLLPLAAQAQSDPSPFLPGKVWLAGRTFYTLAPTNPLSTAPPDALRVVRYRLLVQKGAAEEDAADFAATAPAVLGEPAHWAAAGVHLIHDPEHFDITVLLAPGDTVDRLCAPMKTGRSLSCAQVGRANLNLARWRRGAQSWGEDLQGYRRYLILHEVGHLLSMRHQRCPGPGLPAPVMMQQTKRVAPCVPNATPTPAELELLRQRTLWLLKHGKK